MKTEELLKVERNIEDDINRSCIPKDNDIDALIYMYCCQKVSPSYRAWMQGADAERVKNIFGLFAKLDKSLYEIVKKIAEN